MSRSKATKAPVETSSEDWALLPWRKLERHVYRLQKRIFRACNSQLGCGFSKRAGPGIHDRDCLTEEPCEAKVSRTVLERGRER